MTQDLMLLPADLEQFKPLTFAQTEEEFRFFTKIRERESGCWEWVGCLHHGYGSFSVEGTPRPAHRVSFLWFYGAEALGKLHVDHLCRNRACVHPLHLEAVTQAENNRRVQVGRPRPLKSHCKNGHLMAGRNVGQRSDGKGRYCRQCVRDSCRRYAERRRAAAQ